VVGWSGVEWEWVGWKSRGGLNRYIITLFSSEPGTAVKTDKLSFSGHTVTAMSIGQKRALSKTVSSIEK
jgi:hypothetical protein